MRGVEGLYVSSKVISFWLDEDIYNKLKKIAQEEGVNISTVIRKAIRVYLRRLSIECPKIAEILHGLEEEELKTASIKSEMKS